MPARIHACADLAADLATVAAIAKTRTGALVLGDAEIVTQREALAGVLADPLPALESTERVRTPDYMPV